MTFATIRAALAAARRFHHSHGSRGYTYRAAPDLWAASCGRTAFRVEVYSSRGTFLTIV
jgi:hypothetical protein